MSEQLSMTNEMVSNESSQETETSSTSAVASWCTVPELLWHRESAGVQLYKPSSQQRQLRRPLFGGQVPPSEVQLASTIAWNTSRMQNMILAVGPGTPASLLMSQQATSSNRTADSSEEQDSALDDDDDDDDDDDSDHFDDDDDFDQADHHDQEVVAEEDEDDDDDDNDEPDHSHQWHRVHGANEGHGDDEENKEDHDSNVAAGGQATNTPNQTSPQDVGCNCDSVGQQSTPPWMMRTAERYAPVPSMRHGGCINTATWLTSPWRLSTVNRQGPYGLTSSSFSSNYDTATLATTLQPIKSSECPTQLLTSGDDRLVKFWDVSMAMGTANPLFGGTTSICPFSAPNPRWSSEVARKRWKNYYLKRSTTAITLSGSIYHPIQISGSVVPLLTLSTGHRANIFHATPLDWQMGKVATCGADGYLRLSDVVSETSSIVVSPEYEEGGGGIRVLGFLSLHTNMCFSHHFLTANTGLLCSERGLKRFDVRLPPRDQPSQNLLRGEPYRSCCKACAVYSYSSLSGGEEESAYVFAGGSSATVSLYDLRMTGGDESSSRVIERYRPKSLDPEANVSVSGLDISKDRRELLVSYENDQIYTFPIFPSASSAAGPTLKEIETLEDESSQGKNTVTELCSYGAHLNRFTFLKNAKYAGPNNDYICTGSDSGRAWIYERSSGSVVSFLNADRSTCNGVVPHPSLPFFITYGIDSTAKLWRATLPLDSNVDDSAIGRAKCFHQRPYEMSPLVRNWQAVQTFLDSVDNVGADDDSVAILPDQVPHSWEMARRGRFGRAFLLRPGSGTSQIGNDLHNLPQLLRQNTFACLRALREDDDEPVRSGFGELRRRVSSIRLRHQADRLGLMWNRSIPWMFRPQRQICSWKAPASNAVNTSVSTTVTQYCDLVDLVPDNPSDWIPYDPQMTKEPLPCGASFNLDDYDDLLERYSYVIPPSECFESSRATSWKGVSSPGGVPIAQNGTSEQQEQACQENGSPIIDGAQPSSDGKDTLRNKECCAHDKAALQILCDTATLLKEGGNTALQDGNVHLAASRYDKSLRYCAVAFMDYPLGNLSFPSDPQLTGYSWTPILKVLITTRLNLSMCLLRPEIAQRERAVDQALLALKDLKPFCARKGVVMNGEDEVSTDELASTYDEAKELQAKAYFRLGTAQYDMGDYAASCRSFEHSAKITKAISKSAQPDKLILRRLAEAKRESARQSKRQKKVFKVMLSGEDQETSQTADEGK